MQYRQTTDRSLDPRRGYRRSARRDRGLVSATIAISRPYELITLLLVRLGLVR
jgi:hypothetical protein